MKNLLLINLMSLFLVGCSIAPTRVEYEPPVIMNPPKPEQMNIKDINWQVWNRERMQEILDNTDPNDKRFSWFVLSAEDYGNLSENFQEIIRFIMQQGNNLNYYSESIDSYRKQVDKSGENQQ